MQRIKSFAKLAIVAVTFLTLFAVSSATRNVLAQTNDTPSIGEDIVIKSFESYASLNRDRSIAIREYITVLFNSERHGIFRDIPVVFKNEQGESINVPISDIEVHYTTTEQDRANAVFEIQRPSYAWVRIKIGDPNKYVKGQYTYEIAYRLKNVVRDLVDGQEVFFNITGNGWEMPIERAKSSITYRVKPIDFKCYSGNIGEINSEECESRLNNKSIDTLVQSRIRTGEGVSVAIKYPLGSFDAVPFSQKFIEYLVKNGWIALLILSCYFAYTFWNKHGRDKKADAVPPIFVVTDTLKSLGLLACSFLVNMRLNVKHVVADITNLAVSRNISILNENKKNFKVKFISPDLNAEAPPYYAELLKIITNNYSTETNLNLLVNIHDKMSNLGKIAQQNLIDKGYIVAESEKQKVYSILASAASAGFAIFSFISSTSTYNPIFINYAFAGAISFIVWLIVNLNMSKRTEEGFLLYRDLLGLKKYIALAELKRLEFFNDPDKMVKHFEELLPYAIIFGLEKKWIGAFKDIFKQAEYQPYWYTGQYFNIADFDKSFDSFKNVTYNLTVPPASSSSGFSGRGFSGGGSSGGGGGGSW